MGGSGQYIVEVRSRIVTLGKAFTFEAAHFLPGHEKCGKIHGHTYRVIVKVRGFIKEETGMAIDFHELSEDVRVVLSELDHRFLNDIFSLPTCENIAYYIKDKLNRDYQVEEILVEEGEGGFAIV